MNITSTLPSYTIITPQPSLISELSSVYAKFIQHSLKLLHVYMNCVKKRLKCISVVTSTAPATFLTWSSPSVSPIQGMILEKLDLCVARIEYGVLNPTLGYKKLPGGCGNWQVPQFNPPHRQKLPMRRKSCDTNICHLKNDNSPVVKLWYTAWWINFRRSFQIHLSNYYTITPSGCWNLS